jgi:hypothetical protein
VFSPESFSFNQCSRAFVSMKLPTAKRSSGSKQNDLGTCNDVDGDLFALAFESFSHGYQTSLNQQKKHPLKRPRIRSRINGRTFICRDEPACPSQVLTGQSGEALSVPPDERRRQETRRSLVRYASQSSRGSPVNLQSTREFDSPFQRHCRTICRHSIPAECSTHRENPC